MNSIGVTRSYILLTHSHSRAYHEYVNRLIFFFVALALMQKQVYADLVVMDPALLGSGIIPNIIYRFVWTYLFELVIYVSILNNFKKAIKWCFITNIVTVPLFYLFQYSESFFDALLGRNAYAFLGPIVLGTVAVIVAEAYTLKMLNGNKMTSELLRLAVVSNLFSLIVGSFVVSMFNMIIRSIFFPKVFPVPPEPL